jgi:hypothetical protein
VFGRQKSAQPPPPPLPAGAVKPGGKGRPTPRRREVEQRNRRPLAGPVVPEGATKAERKAARAARRQVVSAERLRQRQAMITGDEKHLPARDRGPVRRFVRDYVDARRNAGEYFIPFALVVMVLSLVRVPVVQLATLVLLYGMVLVVAVDTYLLRRRLNGLLAEKFREPAAGAATYGMLRALQFRRWRLPRAQVRRGQFPR